MWRVKKTDNSTWGPKAVHVIYCCIFSLQVPAELQCTMLKAGQDRFLRDPFQFIHTNDIVQKRHKITQKLVGSRTQTSKAHNVSVITGFQFYPLPCSLWYTCYSISASVTTVWGDGRDIQHAWKLWMHTKLVRKPESSPETTWETWG
jgi:hypothetical protein